MAKIDPISGFPELLPNAQIAFVKAMDLIRHTYESFGFVPMETPIVERVEHLLAKGISDKEVYGLRRLNAEGEDGDKDLALRFDLTVPLARYVAQHYGQLTFPYRRYHMQPVWRGERAQKGRYRQFYQCDIDVIGDGVLSFNHDAELMAVIFRIFTQMDIGAFTIRLNNRKVLEGLLNSAGITSENLKTAINTIDDIEKVPAEVTQQRLVALGLSDAVAAELMTLFGIADNNEDVLARLDARAAENALLAEGLEELRYVLKTAPQFVGEEERPAFAEALKVDLGIARGLDYYTGTVCETRLHSHPQLGSICSGGRYANLAGSFTNKDLPGVGVSIGLSRLVVVLIQEGLLKAEKSTTADVLVTVQNLENYADYAAIGSVLREAGLKVEVYAEPKKLQAQLKYANRKGFTYVVLANAEELAQGVAKLKNMDTGEEQILPVQQLAAAC